MHSPGASRAGRRGAKVLAALAIAAGLAVGPSGPTGSRSRVGSLGLARETEQFAVINF